jgi:hypothetical protein
MLFGLLWQQHIEPQPCPADDPAVNNAVPKIRGNAIQKDFRISNLAPAHLLFIVKYYTLRHFWLSTEMMRFFSGGVWRVPESPMYNIDHLNSMLTHAEA